MLFRSVVIGQTVNMAFVDQSRDDLANDKTVWEDVSGGLDILTVGKFEMPSRAYCGRFNFNGGDPSSYQGTNTSSLKPFIDTKYFGFAYGFTSNGGENKVTMFDLETLKPIKKIDVGNSPDGIFYDAATNRVFTENHGSHDITALDANTGDVVGTIKLVEEISQLARQGLVMTDGYMDASRPLSETRKKDEAFKESRARLALPMGGMGGALRANLGRELDRLAEVCGIEPPSGRKAMSIWPPIRSVISGAMPLYGTCSICSWVTCENFSPIRWYSEPGPTLP